MIIKKTLTTAFLATALIIAGFSLIPRHAYALDFNPLNPLDPFCLFSCDNEPDIQNNTYNNTNTINSYNTNSTIGATTVNTGTVYTDPVYNQHSVVTTPVYNTPVVVNTPVVYNSPVVVNTPVYTNPVVYNTPVVYNSPVIVTTPVYSTPVYSNPIVYNNPVYTPPVYSYNNYNPAPVYNYYPVQTYYSPLAVACSANTTFATVGSTVTWSAYATGGNGSYSYSWSGTDGIYGSGSYLSSYYSYPGVKSNIITVYSNGQQTSARCSNYVTIGSPTVVYNYPVITSSILQVACAADAVSTRIGTPITWSAEATGATGKFIYSWSGTDNLFGTQSSAITSYATAGTKSAIVTVTATNGQSQSKVCSNTVTVKSNAVAKAPAKVVAVAAPAPVAAPVVMTAAPILTPIAAPANTGMTAASLFSLQNVPWGLVAILIILILIGMVTYLFVNRNKV